MSLLQEFRHFSYECRKKQYDQGKQGQNQSTNTSTWTNTMFLACESPLECNVVQESPHDIWYLDLGCRNHMTGNSSLFSSVNKSVQTNVTFGDNIQVIVLGKGIVGILTKQGE